LAQRVHFNTYGGNPVSSAVGRAVLRVIEKDKLQQNCLERGNQFLAGLRKLQQKHSIIGDVRGTGLMLGVEFVKDRQTKEPATPEFLNIFEYLKNNNILVGKGGFFGNVMRIKPPMCVSSADVDFALELLDEAITKNV
jgi:alanine-glyoxylate transaminase / (R)-3-amino-2-methylpropionate-pyruvate transaminase